MFLVEREIGFVFFDFWMYDCVVGFFLFYGLSLKFEMFIKCGIRILLLFCNFC